MAARAGDGLPALGSRAAAPHVVSLLASLMLCRVVLRHSHRDWRAAHPSIHGHSASVGRAGTAAAAAFRAVGASSFVEVVSAKESDVRVSDASERASERETGIFLKT